MGNINRGKDFEREIKYGFERVPEVSVDRLPDQMSGYSGSANICDFIVYRYPYEYYIECKSTYQKSFPYKNLTDNQFSGMLEKSNIDGVIAGVIVWFIKHDITVFLPIQTIARDMSMGHKSFNMERMFSSTEFTANKDFFILVGEKRKIFFDYDMAEFFDRIDAITKGERRALR